MTLRRAGHRGEVYEDKAGEWRWRVKARNGKVLADSAEGYRSKGRAFVMCRRVCRVRKVVVL